MSEDWRKAVPLALAEQVLKSFMPLATDQAGTRNLIDKLWQGHMATPVAGELTRLYNEKAAPEDAISEPVNRIAASMIVTDLLDNIHELRMTVLRNKELRHSVNLKDLQELETYLYAAGKYLTETYMADGEQKYYSPELVIETAINQQRNAPLIGDKGIIPPPRSNLN